MKISNNPSGLSVYLTEEERARMGDAKWVLTFHQKADPHDYLRLHRAGNAGGISPATMPTNRAHPYKLTFRGGARPGQIPYFGPQEVGHRVAGDVWCIDRPDLTVPLQLHKTRESGDKQHSPREEAAAPKDKSATQKSTPRREVGLREAVEAVNHHKQQLGGELCLSVDPDTGRLEAIVRFGG